MLPWTDGGRPQSRLAAGSVRPLPFPGADRQPIRIIFLLLQIVRRVLWQDGIRSGMLLLAKGLNYTKIHNMLYIEELHNLLRISQKGSTDIAGLEGRTRSHNFPHEMPSSSLGGVEIRFLKERKNLCQFFVVSAPGNGFALDDNICGAIPGEAPGNGLALNDNICGVISGEAPEN